MIFRKLSARKLQNHILDNWSRVHGIIPCFFEERCITRIFLHQIWIDIFELFEISADLVEHYDFQKAFCQEITKSYSWQLKSRARDYTLLFWIKMHFQNIFASNLNRYCWLVRNLRWLGRTLWFWESFLLGNYKIIFLISEVACMGLYVAFLNKDALPEYFCIKSE